MQKTFQIWSELEASQWWSPEQLEALQWKRLKKLLEYCFEHSPYYRQLWTSLGVDPRDWQSLSELHQLPITSREMMVTMPIRSVRPWWASRPYPNPPGVRAALRCILSLIAKQTIAGRRPLFVATPGRAGSRYQTNTPLGRRTGETQRLQDWKEYLHSRFLYRRQMLNSFDLSDDSIPLFLDRIYRFQPEVFVAYTNPLYWFARAIEQRGLEAYRPKAMIVGAEKLHDFQRDALESVFAHRCSRPTVLVSSR